MRIAPRPQPARRPRWPWLFAVAMGISTVTSLVAGTVLGYMAAMQHGYGADRWTQSVQAHGQLQLVGWAAVFVAALMFEFGPRLNGAPMLPAGRRALALGALAVGALAGAAGQIWYGNVGFLFSAGAVLAAAGGLGVVALLWGIRPPRPLAADFHPLWLRTSAVWLAAALVLHVAAVARADGDVVRLGDSRLVAEVLVRGFLLTAVFGVALRAFVGHLGNPAMSQRRQRILWAAFAATLVAWMVGSGAFGLPDVPWLRRAADVAFAGALLAGTAWLGMAGAVRRMRAGERYQWLVPAAWAGLVLYAVALVGWALAPGWEERTLYEEGAVRHVFLLAFIAPLMAAMAHVVLARFGTGRVHWQNALTASFFLIVAAAPLRVLPALFVAAPGRPGQMAMGLAAASLQVGLVLMAAVAFRNAVMIRRMVGH